LSLVTPTPARIQKTAHGFLGVLAADTDDDGENARLVRRDFVKRCGFFFQGETDEGGHGLKPGQCDIPPDGRQPLSHWPSPIASDA
jgi:hypothetical protein